MTHNPSLGDPVHSGKRAGDGTEQQKGHVAVCGPGFLREDHTLLKGEEHA